ncbi:hypothetical protein OEZ86_001252 [Tetradesmus obliquus]|nr:hypothetical protein OEZ86_001252 [Tetradesmus obliquus]
MAGKRLQDVAASGFAKSSYAPSALCDLESKPFLQATGRHRSDNTAAPRIMKRRSDANAKRVILRCKQVEASLGSRPVGQGHRLAVGLPCGGSCQVMQGCMQPACLGCMGCCMHKRRRVA